ncbi:hypothetical protein DPMN_053758 [Dreissena polymorpha]|uniref:Uncharacterized protein n=1 Tax=Dreissena polymorpha TaxID=45954 RepID=A0A9D4HSH7_DREPO|nr:hypothetical protein DPMN_053758 [Dreissena polymorpha]
MIFLCIQFTVVGTIFLRLLSFLRFSNQVTVSNLSFRSRRGYRININAYEHPLKDSDTTVQLPLWSLMVLGLKFVPILTKTHTEDQCINMSVFRSYTAAKEPSRMLPSSRNVTDKRGSF